MGRETNWYSKGQTVTAREKRKRGHQWGENVTAGDNTGIIGQTTSFKY